MNMINTTNFDKTSWRKSSRSAAATNCIEVAMGEKTIGVRDSRNPDKGILIFSPHQWKRLIKTVAHGRLGP
jgi:Domain of unknown function (DUF397)